MTKFLTDIFFGALHLLGKTVARTYYLFFGRHDRHVAERQDSSLAEEIAISWEELLVRHSGHILPAGNRKANMDYAMCTVTFQAVQIRVIRGRGEYRIQIRSPILGGAWFEVTQLLDKLGVSISSSPDEEYYLANIGHVVDEQWEAIGREIFIDAGERHGSHASDSGP